MKLTDDIEAALHSAINMFGSKSAFARRANISVYTLRKYLKRKTKFISDETWEKMYPHIKDFLGQKKQESTYPSYKNHLTTEQRILLDAFSELPSEIRKRKLEEITKLAHEEVKKRHAD